MTVPWDLYYQEGQAKVREQDSLRRELSGRASNLLTTSIALIVAGVLVLTLVDREELGAWVLAAAALTMLFWWGVIGGWYMVIAPVKNWNDGSNLNSLGEASGQPEYSEDDLRWYAAENYRTAWKENKPHLERKVRAIKVAGYALLLQAGCIVVYAALVVATLSAPS